MTIHWNFFREFALVANVVAGLCILAILGAVLIDFLKYQNRAAVKKEQKSIVATATMVAFFVGFYAILRFRIGQVAIDLTWWSIIVAASGVFLMIYGCVINIRGRLRLGQNWSDQIVVYRDHALVNTGVFGLVRHPLYASLIWMFGGASLMYFNFAAGLADVLIFIPAMYYRAKQEETALSKEFPDYAAYQKKVGMFFPKIFTHHDQI